LLFRNPRTDATGRLGAGGRGSPSAFWAGSAGAFVQAVTCSSSPRARAGG
jgi:hypothetical protein